MKMNKSSLLCLLVLSFSGLVSAQQASPLHPDAGSLPPDGWNLQSSGKVEAQGEPFPLPRSSPD